MILGLASILTVIGFSTLAVVCVNTRATSQGNDWVKAQLLAFSAAEHALTKINATSDWRTSFAGATTEHALGSGTFRWRIEDELDGDLTDDSGDPFVILATGQVNDAVYKLRLLSFISGQPLDALNTTVHAGRQVRIKRGWYPTELIADGAPVSSNSKLKVDRFCTIYGEGQAKMVDNRGRITEGYTESPDYSLPLPSSGVFAVYSSMIQPTVLGDPGGSLYNTVLTPTVNSLGGQTNANGAYFIDRGNRDLILTNCNVEGTLVVRCKKLILQGAVSMRNYRTDFPVLIVDGNVEMSFYAPGEVRGLVHVKRSLTLKSTARIRGAVICEKTVNCEGWNRITHLPELYTNPPLGYTTGEGEIRPETWARITD